MPLKRAEMSNPTRPETESRLVVSAAGLERASNLCPKTLRLYLKSGQSGDRGPRPDVKGPPCDLAFDDLEKAGEIVCPTRHPGRVGADGVSSVTNGWRINELLVPTQQNPRRGIKPPKLVFL